MALPIINVDDTRDVLDTVGDVATLDSGRLGAMQKFYIGLKGSYGGVLMVGIITGIIGMSIINPLSLAAGAVIGRKAYKDDTEARLQRRRNEAKGLIRRQIDEIIFQVGKQLRDRLRIVQRTTRDHFTTIADEHHRSLADSVLAAQKAATMYATERDNRVTALRRDLERVDALTRRARAIDTVSTASTPISTACPEADGCRGGRRPRAHRRDGSGVTVRVLDEARGLLDAAAERYRDDPDALRRLEEHARRLDEPLRVAIAGRVKAGKSTLLNAVIGEAIAPTDAGECTRVITWYHHGTTPRITMHLRTGGARSLPFRRDAAALVLDLGSTAGRGGRADRRRVALEAARGRDAHRHAGHRVALDRDLRAHRRVPRARGAPSEADAIIYLMRHLHSTDVGFLAAFHDAAVGRSATVNAMAVLSRADEIGAGRIDALLSARTIAERYRTDGALRSLALDIVPIAGLVAQTARTLRQHEFEALREVARLAATPGNGCSSRSTGSSGRMPRSTCPPTRGASCSTASACSASGCRRSRSAPDATTRPTWPTSSTGAAAWTTCCGPSPTSSAPAPTR